MATTISCEVMRAGARMPRATINKQQFIECGVLRGGALTPDAKIGSSAQVVSVKNWTPGQNDEEVFHGHTVKANIKAINTKLKDLYYETGTDFLGGVLNNVEPVGDALNLVTTPSGDDFEGYTVPISPIGNGWTARTTASNWQVVDGIPGSSQVGKAKNYNQKTGMSLDSGPNVSDVQLKARVRFLSGTGGGAYLSLRMTGSGTALRGYVAGLDCGSSIFYLGRYTGDGLTYGLALNWAMGWTVVAGEWYWIRFKATGSTLSVKAWKDGDAEPVDWHVKGDSSHPGPGDVGLHSQSGLENQTEYFDDLEAEPIPPAYASSGEWTHDVDVIAAEHYSFGRITWDEVTPTDTTAAVYARWRDTDSWVQQTSGGGITGVDLGDDMRAGATRDTLSLRVVLTSSDPLNTPAVSKLRVYFEPVTRDQIEIVVHGAANTMAANTLLDWGMAWLRPVAQEPYVEVLDWSDLWFQTIKRWMARDEQTVTAALNYWGNLIESITFKAEPGPKYRNGHEPCEWVVPALVMASGPMLYEWTALTAWWPMGHNFTWNIIDKGQAIHADYRWLVGHPQINDHTLSFLLAVPSITDHPLSILARAYARNDHPLSMLIQGWRRDDHPLSYLVGVWAVNDHPVSMLVAIEYLDDHPLSMVVYGVNREGMIEVNVISDSTWAELSGLGYTRS